MICPQCGQQASGNFCANCGARLTRATSPPPPQPVAGTPPAPQSAPDATTAPPSPAPVSSAAPPAGAALCPVCRAGTLAASEHKGLLHTTREFVCERCGAVLIEHPGTPEHLELSTTRNPATAAPAAPRSAWASR